MLSAPESENGASLTELSARHWLDDTELPGGDRLLLGGAARIPDTLCDGVTVSLGRVVTHVDWSEGRPLSITVHDRATGAERKERYDVALVTVPLGVLQADAVSFSPPLPPPKQAAVSRIGFGPRRCVCARCEGGPLRPHLICRRSAVAP